MLRSALRPSAGPPAATSLGRFELLCEAFRSDLGPLWAVRATTGHSGGDVLHARRFSIEGADPGIVDELSDAAFWGMDVSHAKVTRVVDVVVEGSELALVQERHEGEPLASLLRLARNSHAPMALPVALRVALDVVEALAAVHAAGRATSSTEYAYGGVSPDSIVVGTDGVTRLLDVGASAVVARCRPWANRPGVIGYRSPEQVETKKADIRVDVFSVGVLLWEMISNHRLFAAANPDTALTAMKTRSIYRLDSPRLRLGSPPPPAVADLVERALERDPRTRCASIEELGASLRLVSSSLAADAGTVAAALRELAGQKLESRAKALARAMLGAAPEPPPDGPRRAETMRGLQAQAADAVASVSAAPAPMRAPVVEPPREVPLPPVAPPAVPEAPAPQPRPVARVQLEKAARPKAKTLVGIPGPAVNPEAAAGAQRTPLEIAVPRKQMQTLLGIPPPAQLSGTSAPSKNDFEGFLEGEEETTVAGQLSPLAGKPEPPPRPAVEPVAARRAPLPPPLPRLDLPPSVPDAPRPQLDSDATLQATSPVDALFGAPSPAPAEAVSLEPISILPVGDVPAPDDGAKRAKKSRRPPPVPAPALESVLPKPLPDVVPPEPTHEAISAEALEREARRGAQKSLPDGVIAIRPLIAVSIPSDPPPPRESGRAAVWVAVGVGVVLLAMVAAFVLTGREAPRTAPSAVVEPAPAPAPAPVPAVAADPTPPPAPAPIASAEPAPSATPLPEPPPEASAVETPPPSTPERAVEPRPRERARAPDEPREKPPKPPRRFEPDDI